MLLNLEELKDYNKWIEKTPSDIYHSVVTVGGWDRVFPGPLPRWASRIRQYFNTTPMTLGLMDDVRSSPFLNEAQKALPASARAKAYRDQLQSRGMGIISRMPGSSTKPGTWLIKPDSNAVIESWFDRALTGVALSGHVYEDRKRRQEAHKRVGSIDRAILELGIVWFQMSPGGAIYHFGEKKIGNPTLRAFEANRDGQERAPVFKLICPDGTGGSREVCLTNPFVVPSLMGAWNGTSYAYKTMVGHKSIGAVGEEVYVMTNRIVKDSVAQGSYNYAETIVKGYPAHVRYDVDTDPMEPGYYVEPPDLFEYSDLWTRRFPPNDPQGKPLADQKKDAP